MPVGTPVQPNFETQNAAVYKGAIDNAIAVASRTGFAFAVHESDPPAMSVTVAAGALFAAGAVTEVAEQLIDEIEAPDTHPRIDFVVVDTTTGVASLVEGDEAAEPVPPAVLAGKLPLAMLALATDTTAITNQDIEDRRVGGGGGGGGLNPGPPSELTVAGGAVTVDGGYHTVDTEGDAASDNLDTIDASALGEGAWLVLAAENASRVVTVRSGEANVNLAGPNYALDDLDKRLVLQKVADGTLVEVARSHAATEAGERVTSSIHMNGTGTISIDSSSNVSGITDLGTGYQRVTFENDYAGDYRAVGSTGDAAVSAAVLNFYSRARPTTHFEFTTYNNSGVAVDCPDIDILVCGDLA